jgi:predicted phosphodiesterase
MKLLIFSDTHLSAKFDQAKYRYLLNIISGADQVIINGDFWDSYLTTFDQFINSDWQQLFPVLKQKKTIYIYGNHDPKHLADDRVYAFSVEQGMSKNIEADGVSLRVQHGHQIVLKGNGPKGEWDRFIGRLSGTLEFFLRSISNRTVNTILEPLNNKMKEWERDHVPHNHILVCGHTHIQENAAVQNFINSGVNNYGLGQYLLVNDGKIELHSVKYYTPLLNVQVASQI